MKIVSGVCKEGSYVQLSIAGGEGLGSPRIITRKVHCSQDAGLSLLCSSIIRKQRWRLSAMFPSRS